MKSRITVAIVVISILFSLSACGNSPNQDDKQGDVSIEEEYNGAVDVVENNDDEVEQEEIDDNKMYVNKVYYAGVDIPIGEYTVNCTNADYAMDIILFNSEKEYLNFLEAEQFTMGEYQEAIETHARVNLYLEKDEIAYISLNEGNIILLDDGMCEFSKYDTSSISNLYPGVYLIGEDLAAGNIDINCKDDYMQVTVFKCEDDYLSYFKTHRFTIGEESDAIDKYALQTNFIQSDNIISVRLSEGMILMVEDGIGEIIVDDGPIIN